MRRLILWRIMQVTYITISTLWSFLLLLLDARNVDIYGFLNQVTEFCGYEISLHYKSGSKNYVPPPSLL